jgi:predicted GNAT family acetyltransferase
MVDSEITDNVALHRFELPEQGDTAFLLYERTPTALRLIHTEVPDALRGKGVGSKLVSGVIDLAEQNGLKIIPLCPFVIEFLKAHPQFLATVDDHYRYLVQTR